jgi:hypothetical protein
MQLFTQRCARCPRVTDLYYCRAVDEYLCEDCIEQVADEEAPECDGTWDDPRYYNC